MTGLQNGPVFTGSFLFEYPKSKQKKGWHKASPKITVGR